MVSKSYAMKKGTELVPSNQYYFLSYNLITLPFFRSSFDSILNSSM